MKQSILFSGIIILLIASCKPKKVPTPDNGNNTGTPYEYTLEVPDSIVLDGNYGYGRIPFKVTSLNDIQEPVTVSIKDTQGYYVEFLKGRQFYLTPSDNNDFFFTYLMYPGKYTATIEASNEQGSTITKQVELVVNPTKDIVVANDVYAHLNKNANNKPVYDMEVARYRGEDYGYFVNNRYESLNVSSEGYINKDDYHNLYLGRVLLNTTNGIRAYEYADGTGVPISFDDSNVTSLKIKSTVVRLDYEKEGYEHYQIVHNPRYASGFNPYLKPMSIIYSVIRLKDNDTMNIACWANMNKTILPRTYPYR